VDVEAEKREAAQAAVALVEDGMAVGLGTGSTVNLMLEALAARKLSIRCIATSVRTEVAARELGLPVEPFDDLDELDLVIDGADQIAADGWIVKGGGGAHTREKIAAAAADRLVIIASSDKLVERVQAPIPLELLRFGCASTLRRLAPVKLRDVAPSPDGNLIADYFGEVGDPRTLSARFDFEPGIVDHGIFPPEIVTDVFVGAKHMPGAPRRRPKH
jgi:ribose 5-phosphate isomerase A